MLTVLALSWQKSGQQFLRLHEAAAAQKPKRPPINPKTCSPAPSFFTSQKREQLPTHYSLERNHFHTSLPTISKIQNVDRKEQYERSTTSEPKPKGLQKGTAGRRLVVCWLPPAVDEYEAEVWLEARHTQWIGP